MAEAGDRTEAMARGVAEARAATARQLHDMADWLSTVV